MRIWASPYSLIANGASPVGTKSRSRERSGALIKVETSQGVGYADVHPWPELGDEDLATQLDALARRHPLQLGTRSLGLAALDREARARGASAFEDLRIPPSHRLFAAVEEVTETSLAQAWADGFRHVKLKLGRDLYRESEVLLAHAFALSAFRVRLDFNEILTAAEYVSFIGLLPEPLREAIEFVEDPIVFSPEAWIELGLRTSVPLAIDRSFQRTVSGFEWVVIKPAIQDPVDLADWTAAHRRNIAVTSYLDHPVGQMGAALEAARLAETRSLGVCGLVSHLNFEKNTYSEAVNAQGPKLEAARGTGIGFDDLLESENWKELK